MKLKIKPPAKPKVVLMQEVTDALQAKYPHEPHRAIEYLCNFFTGADLDGILRDLGNGG